MGEDARGREAEVGTRDLVGDESDDQNSADGEGDLQEDGIPAEAIVRGETIVAPGRGEEALDDCARGNRVARRPDGARGRVVASSD